APPRTKGCWFPISQSSPANSACWNCLAARRADLSWLGEIHDDGNMVGGLVPTARLAQDPRILDIRRQARRYPDVIQPPAPVGGIPIGGAIAPPAVEALAGRNDLAHRINPFGRGLQAPQLLHLDGRMAH